MIKLKPRKRRKKKNFLIIMNEYYRRTIQKQTKKKYACMYHYEFVCTADAPEPSSSRRQRAGSDESPPE